ncbi:MAG: hypothetical protein M3Q65_17985 [Chloroflexota bacterium]|nr:hypothetical protein [Chloroflexota bacterium]
MDSQEQLRQLITAQQERLGAALPGDRQSAVIALVRARDRVQLAAEAAVSSAATGDDAGRSRLYAVGWNKALRLCLADRAETSGATSAPGGDRFDEWAERFIQECGRLGEAELVLAGCETGFLQIQHGGERLFDAWVATRRMPTEWREREDFAWWAASLARRTEREWQELAADRPQVRQQLRALVGCGALPGDVYMTTPALDDYYRRLGLLHARRMAHQHSYPDDAAIGGCTFGLYRDLLARLIGWALRDLDLCVARGENERAIRAGQGLAVPRSETALVGALAAALNVDAALVRRALRSLTLDRENAGYHDAPSGAAPPLIRADEDRLVWSATGLLSEPFVFLARELRRRHAQEYHNAAYLREGVFRQDLYRLFADKRFVRSVGRVELQREGGRGGVRTDLDAVVFDRKTGTLGIFELKAQDPFARSVAERLRQRDNFYHAGRQVAAILHWLQRHGGDALLARVDGRTAKGFRVQKVHVFVLGRYLAHFAEGPEPDRRAAWGTWPQVLRLVDERPFGPSDANPIRALFDKLVKDTPLNGPIGERGVREIAIGDGRVRVYPSFAAYKKGEDHG